MNFGWISVEVETLIVINIKDVNNGRGQVPEDKVYGKLLYLSLILAVYLNDHEKWNMFKLYYYLLNIWTIYVHYTAIKTKIKYGDIWTWKILCHRISEMRIFCKKRGSSATLEI